MDVLTRTTTVSIRDTYLERLPPEAFIDLVDGYEQVVIKVSTPSSRTMLDVAFCYMEASYVFEKLANSFNCSEIRNTKSGGGYEITVQEFDHAKLSALIFEFVCILSSNEYIDEDEAFSYIEKRQQFECDIYEIPLHFPDLIDLYYANMINGGLNEDGIELENRAPAHRYGYWHAAEYLCTEKKILYSQNCWVVPNEVDLKEIFKRNGYDERLSIIPANLLLINSEAMVLSENAALQVPMGEVIQGIACIHEVLPSDETGYFPHMLDKLNGGFFASSSNYNFFNSTKPSSFWNDNTAFELTASEFGEFVIFKTDTAKLIVFNVTTPPYTRTVNFLSAMNTISSSFEDGLTPTFSQPLDWNKLTDEEFECLCYDVIYYNSKFDWRTVKKMGRSRSRDGGRDIVVSSRRHLLPSAAPLRTVRATFTAYGSSLH
ncbi:hypothetical protein [Vibrio quintilis]|uniref:Uncharacterized protein n=1 Tax=Vibrio quintilis TaxID=1117707 RepID=A0A1M7YYC8_9VIBR|nr:hypothetical protein [Vibrio quintilis]SHO57650.1 hypothetical protein VQ7734_03420 [Vibrio quintilis]